MEYILVVLVPILSVSISAVYAYMRGNRSSNYERRVTGLWLIAIGAICVGATLLLASFLDKDDTEPYEDVVSIVTFVCGFFSSSLAANFFYSGIVESESFKGDLTKVDQRSFIMTNRHFAIFIVWTFVYVLTTPPEQKSTRALLRWIRRKFA